MMHEFWNVMTLPLVACFLLTGIHAYLGFHVIERQVIFADLTLAQIAALGTSVGILWGYGLESPHSYWLSLGFTVLGAAVFSLTRFRKQQIPQEAIIGIVYVVAAAVLILILSRSGEGDEYIRQSLIGNILLVTKSDIWRMLAIYSIVAVIHAVFRHQFLLISQSPQEAFARGMNVRSWDFLFYASFGFVVTSSVKMAGVLLVFAFLIIPPVCAMFFSNQLHVRLILGWLVGFVASVLGMVISYYGDLPTGASVICTFGGILVLCLFKKIFIR